MAETTAIKRRKPKSERKLDAIHLRMSTKDKARIEATAKHLKLDTSAWLRSLALQKADEVLGPEA